MRRLITRVVRWLPARLRTARGACLTLGLIVLAAAVWLRCGPLPPGLLDPVRESTIVVDRNGTPLYEALSGDGTRTLQITGDAIPPLVAAATLAAEDHRFWWHPGVDPLALLRAARRNVSEGAIVEGGSTITQQVAKLLVLRQGGDRRRGWAAKLREAVIALRLEHRLTKPEILALYLNLAAYGNQITGVERASRAYFGTSASMLTIAQAGFLAGLPQRPTSFNPYRHEALATSRQRVVLARMVAAGAISAADRAEALRERLNLARGERPFLAPHFVQMVLGATPAPRPARIVTTLDAALQQDILGIIASHRPALDRHGARNVAVVVLDNERGEWLAWEGSGNYLDRDTGGTINGAMSPRQPGSALKPFTYAAAFEEGLTPATVLPDVPSSFPTAEPGVVYSPRNYDGRYRGPLLARAALAGSENVPAVALAAEVGVPRILRLLQRAGFSTLQKTASHYGLGVTLGNAEVRLDEMVAAYAAFARDGEWLAPTYLPAGIATRERRRLVSARTAFWVTDILSDADARAYIFGRGGSLELPFPAAVKTGTSQAYHDNWTIGYTRRVTVGVWVGNFDRQPLRSSSGVTGAAPIFQAVMLAAQARLAAGDHDPVAVPHESLSRRPVCSLSGEGANAWCPAVRAEWLPRERDPGPCTWHQASGDGVEVIWPAAYRDWARGQRLPAQPRAAAEPGAVRAAARRQTPSAAALQIANPPDGATYSIDPTLRREFQTLQLRAVTAAPATLEWRVNGELLERGRSDVVVEWPLRRGRYVFSVRDQAGRTSETTITVR